MFPPHQSLRDSFPSRGSHENTSVRLSPTDSRKGCPYSSMRKCLIGTVGNGLDRSVVFDCRGVFCENGKPFVGNPTFPLSREYIVRPRTAARAVPTISMRKCLIDTVGNGLDRSVDFDCRGVFCENGKPFVVKPTFPLSREYIVRLRTAARAVPTIQCIKVHILQAMYSAETICFTSLPLEGKVAAEPSDEV